MVASEQNRGGLDPRAMVARAAKYEALAIAAGDDAAFRAWRLNRNLWESRVTAVAS
jgi:hypothetical protein